MTLELLKPTTQYDKMLDPMGPVKVVSRAKPYVDGKKYCPRCEDYKEPSEFSKRKRSPDGLQIYCKLCSAEQVFNIYQADPVKKNVQVQNSRAKRLEVPGEITLSQWLYQLKVFNHLCAYCSVAGETLEIEHIHQMSSYKYDNLLATNTVENIVPACKECNSRKNILGLEPFLTWLYKRVEPHPRFLSHHTRGIDMEKVLTGSGSKAHQRADREDRSIVYKDFHRTLDRKLCAQDIDQVEYRMVNGEPVPVAVIELTRADSAAVNANYLAKILERFDVRDMQGKVIRAIAERLGVRAYIVVFNQDASRFYVYCLTTNQGWAEANRAAYEFWLANMKPRPQLKLVQPIEEERNAA